ncbi:MAG: hypothetical protein AAFV62_09755 [Pseudomonadota bacterium]
MRGLGKALRQSVLGVAGGIVALLTQPAIAETVDVCQNPVATCGALVEPACLQRHGAGVIALDSVSVECEQQISSYRHCLRDVAQRCAPQEQVEQDKGSGDASACSQEQATALWQEVSKAGRPAELRAFASVCPDSQFALIATIRADALEAEAEAEAKSQANPNLVVPPTLQRTMIGCDLPKGQATTFYFAGGRWSRHAEATVANGLIPLPDGRVKLPNGGEDYYMLDRSTGAIEYFFGGDVLKGQCWNF